MGLETRTGLFIYHHMTTTQTPEEELAALVAEAKQLAASIPALRQQLATEEERLSRLRGEWRDKGLIYYAELKVRDSKFPIYCPVSSWTGENRFTRVIEVTDGFVTLRNDNSESQTRYRRKDGFEERTRSKWANKIDIEKALKIWAEHQAKLESEVEK